MASNKQNQYNQRDQNDLYSLFKNLNLCLLWSMDQRGHHPYQECTKLQGEHNTDNGNTVKTNNNKLRRGQTINHFLEVFFDILLGMGYCLELASLHVMVIQLDSNGSLR